MDSTMAVSVYLWWLLEFQMYFISC